MQFKNGKPDVVNEDRGMMAREPDANGWLPPYGNYPHLVDRELVDAGYSLQAEGIAIPEIGVVINGREATICQMLETSETEAVSGAEPASSPLTGSQGPWLQLRIDPEIAGLGPTMKTAEFRRLEACIRDEGREPVLTIWTEESIILDGLYSMAICQEHGLPCQIVGISLPDREAAKAWVIQNQLGRPDLTDWQRAELALKLKPLVKARAKEPAPTDEDLHHDEGPEHVSILGILASKTGVAKETLRRAAFILRNAQGVHLDLLDRGEISIDVVYETIRDAQDPRLSVRGMEYELPSPPRGTSLAILRNECNTFVKYLASFGGAYRARRVSLDPDDKGRLQARLECARNEIEAFLGVLEDDDRAVVTAASPEA
jgi:hypothetical protein